MNPYSHIGGNPELDVRLIHGRDADLGKYDVPPKASADYEQALLAEGYSVGLTDTRAPVTVP